MRFSSQSRDFDINHHNPASRGALREYRRTTISTARADRG
jgi:hypothetical protein